MFVLIYYLRIETSTGIYLQSKAGWTQPTCIEIRYTEQKVGDSSGKSWLFHVGYKAEINA
jgi:hypothetical protein